MDYCKRKGVMCECLTDHSVCNSDNCHRSLPDKVENPDNDIIKALDICGHLDACADCPLGCLEGVDKCMHTLLLNALDLINRQKEEIERVKALYNIKCMDFEMAVAEAIKEFAERLKSKPSRGIGYDGVGFIIHKDIDNLVKEMTEEH